MQNTNLTLNPSLGRTFVRDQRLDFWRGLCLIDMVVVHLVQYGMQFGALGHEVLADYTRFAAGGYVLISGMTVGFVFFPRVLDPERRRAAYVSLFRRAVYIYLIHTAVTVLEVLILCPMRGDPIGPIDVTLFNTLTFRQGYDLLPFYVIMLALCPFVLELMRRRLGWAVALLSTAGFLWGKVGYHYADFSPPITKTFFVVLWQPIFLMGIFAGTRLRWYGTLSTRTKQWTMAGFWLASTLIFFAAYGDHFHLRLPTPLSFWKIPLTFGEILRYICLVGAIVTTTDLLWRWIGDSAVAAYVNRLGRRSLAMYIAQIYVVGYVNNLVDSHPGPWGTQFFFMALALTILWLIALAMDTIAVLRARVRETETPLFAEPSGLTAS